MVTLSGRRRRLSRGNSGDTVIGAVILAALTVGVGIFILGVASGWLGATLQSSTNEANRAILLVKTSAQLSFEAVNFTSSSRIVILRNVADVPVTITRIELATPRGGVKASYPPEGFSKLAEVGPGGHATLRREVIPICTSCLPLETLRLRIWYVASSLFREDNPVLSADEMRYSETVVVYPAGEVVSRCPLPPNWMTVDVIDPITFSDIGRIPLPPNNKIHVRFPYASASATVSVDLQVINASGTYGFATRNVPTISNEMYSFTGSFGGFQVPLRIYVLAAGFNVLQREWRLGGIPGKAHASGVTLWSNAEKMVDVVEVELGVNDLEGGRYRITVNLYDCNGDLITSKFVTTSIPRGIFVDSVFVDVPLTALTDIARVDVLVEEV